MSKYWVLLGPKDKKPKLTWNKEDFEDLVGGYFDEHPRSWAGIFKDSKFAYRLVGKKFYKKDIYDENGEIIYHKYLGYVNGGLPGPFLYILKPEGGASRC